MRKAARKFLRAAGYVLGGLFVLVLAAVLLFLFDKPLVKNLAVNYLAAKAGASLTVGKLDYTLSPLHVTLTSVKAVYKTAAFTVTVDARRIEAAGSLKKLLGGEMPALDFVEADIAELVFDQTKVSEEPIDLAVIIPQLGDSLAMSSKTSLTCGGLDLKVPGQRFRIESLALSCARTSAAPAGRTFDVRLDTGAVTAAMTPGDVALRTRLHAGGTLTLAPAAGLDLHLLLDSPEATAAGKTLALERVALDAAGSWKLKENAVALTKWAFDAPRLMSAAGSLDADLGKDMSISGEGQVRVEDLESASALLKPFLPPQVRDARLHGAVLVTGRGRVPPRSERKGPTGDAVVTLDHFGIASAYQGVPFDAEVTGSLKAALAPGATAGAGSAGPGRLDATLGIDDARVEYSAPNLPLRIRLAGSLKGSGTPADFKGTADIRASSGPISRNGVSINGATVRLQASGSRSAIGISRFEAALAKPSAVLSGGKKVAFEELKLDGRAGFDVAGRSLALDALEVSVPTLPPLRIDGRYDLDPRGVRRASLQWHGLPVPALRSLSAPFLPAGLAGWTFDGTVGLDLTGSSLPALRNGSAAALPGWQISGNLALAGAAFNDPDFTIASEKLESAVKFNATRPESTGDIDWSAAVDLKHGESLWKAFYVKWDARPLRADLSGRFKPAAKTLENLEAKIALQTVGEVYTTGLARLGPPSAFSLRTLARVDLEPFYALSTQAGAAEGRMKVGGSVRGQFDIAGEGPSLTVKGRLTAEGVDVESPASGILLKGLDADIPVDYANAQAWEKYTQTAAASGGTAPTSPEGKGTLEIREIKTPFADIPKLALTLWGSRNACRIDPVAVELFGARLELGATSLALDPKTGGFRGTSSLSLPSLDLSRLPGVSPRLPLSGVVRAAFPSLEISGSSIATEGRVEADIFGGKVVVRDVFVADPFKPSRAISANVDILDIDLKKATDVIPFGEMTGIVRGEVRGLTISYGQPESFIFRLESVPRKGVAQTFSLKAVDNLTVLSSGQSASAGTGSFWMKFIRGFRYAKLGIVSTLRNDTFTLNGMVHEKGVEYLVKKPPLFGINVINRMPDKKISFKEMMSRLERVGQSESPQVKK